MVGQTYAAFIANKWGLARLTPSWYTVSCVRLGLTTEPSVSYKNKISQGSNTHDASL